MEVFKIMLKKGLAVLVVVLMLAMASTQTVFAAVLQVDMNNPALRTDTWEYNPPDIVFTIDRAFDIAPVAGDGQSRFSANVQVGQGNIAGDGPTILPSGSAVNNAVFPFAETVRVNSVTLRWNNGLRQFFVRFYTSMDGVNWTEAAITNNAQRVTVSQTWDATGATAGPAAEVFATTPAGLRADGTPDDITFTLQETPAARYFKIQGFGNDNATGDLAVVHQWFSFNNLIFEGSVYVPPPPPVTGAEEAAPAADAGAPAPQVAAPATAPRTFDPITLAALGALAAGTGAVIVNAKKRK